jgi:hypothetical protein
MMSRFRHAAATFGKLVHLETLTNDLGVIAQLTAK